MSKISIKNKACQNDVLKTLLYFDTFQYPLIIHEIVLFSKYSLEEIQNTLANLVSKNIIYKLNDFYAVTKKTCKIERRKKGNIKAKKIFKKAKKVSKLISQFPFIEGVFISGSLSKGYFGQDDDIDYFLVTKPNRVWLARTFLIVYKKIFLLNSKKYFCVNYFMSSNALEIEEQNRFTATELATLIPMSGNGIYKKLQNKNLWVLDFFPNYDTKKTSIPIKRSKLKRVFEYFFNGKIGDFLELKFMKITKNHQSKKFKKLNKVDFDIAFKGNRNASKHHPDNHQKRVINLLNDKIKAFNKENHLNIPLENLK